MLEVANELKKRKRDFELWFLGQGEKQKEMEEKIEEYDLHDRVKIWGYRKNPYPFFKRADAVVLCSFSEGFPTVLAEGLHFGKPFISTDVGGTDELSDGGKCGFVAGSRGGVYGVRYGADGQQRAVSRRIGMGKKEHRPLYGRKADQKFGSAAMGAAGARGEDVTRKGAGLK